MFCLTMSNPPASAPPSVAPATDPCSPSWIAFFSSCLAKALAVPFEARLPTPSPTYVVGSINMLLTADIPSKKPPSEWSYMFKRLRKALAASGLSLDIMSLAQVSVDATFQLNICISRFAQNAISSSVGGSASCPGVIAYGLNSGSPLNLYSCLAASSHSGAATISSVEGAR